MLPNSRIPTRPLSYDEVGLAYKRELILDYDKGILYMKDDEGNIRCITSSIVTQVINEIMLNPDDFDFAHYITIVFNDERYPLDIFSQMLKETLDRLKDLLGWKIDATVDPSTGQITDSSTVLGTIQDILAEIEKLKNQGSDIEESIMEMSAVKTATYETSVTVTPDDWTTLIDNKHYSKTVKVENIRSLDRAKVYPIYSEDYNTMIGEMGAVGSICRVISNDGSITIYALSKPKVDFTLGLEIPRRIHKGIPYDDYTEYDPVAPDPEEFITFNINIMGGDGEYIPSTYTGIKGMTWGDWIKSKYNTDDYILDASGHVCRFVNCEIYHLNIMGNMVIGGDEEDTDTDNGDSDLESPDPEVDDNTDTDSENKDSEDTDIDNGDEENVEIP